VLIRPILIGRVDRHSALFDLTGAVQSNATNKKIPKQAFLVWRVDALQIANRDSRFVEELVVRKGAVVEAFALWKDEKIVRNAARRTVFDLVGSCLARVLRRRAVLSSEAPHLGVDPLDLVLVMVHRRSLGKYDAAKNAGIMGERNQIFRLWDAHVPLVDVLEGNGLSDLVQRTDLVVGRSSFDLENAEAPVRLLLLPVNLNDVRADCCACMYIC
jgi:hypothetical protein